MVVKTRLLPTLESTSAPPHQQTTTHKFVVDLDQFENYLIQLREIYADQSSEANETQLQSLFTADNAFYKYKLIGVANLFLDALLFTDDIGCRRRHLTFEYSLPVVSQQGEISARLRVRFQRLSSTSEHLIRFRVCIIEAHDLSIKNLSNLVYVQYQFWSQAQPTIISSMDETVAVATSRRNSVKFNHEFDLETELTEDFVDFCQEEAGALSLALLNDRHALRKQSKQNAQFFAAANTKQNRNYIEQLNSLEQIAKQQSLIDCWGEVSRSYELAVRILELNTEGHWRPVQVKDSDWCETGGVYLLKQGQSRQISLTLWQTKPSSVLFYNGLLFNVEPHQIESVSVGCIVARDVNLNVPLDSYHEVDLARLRDRLRRVLDARKQYLYAQINQIADLLQKSSSSSSFEEEKERYDSLCKQLVDLGEEQAAIDAPSDNSHLPGSTIQWQPAPGMEKHVPIHFFDLKDQHFSSSSSPQKQLVYSSDDCEEEDFEELSSSEKRSRSLGTYGTDCCLKSESPEAVYLDLKLISWNDSSQLEIRDADTYEEHDEGFTDSSSFPLKAVCRWDSSEHKSIYMNQITPLDNVIYLTVKANLKLRLNPVINNSSSSNTRTAAASSYINLTIRKRICVCIGLNSSLNSPASPANNKLMSLNRFKTMLGSTAANVIGSMAKPLGAHSAALASKQPLNYTACTYRFISSVPRMLTEIENRESLAIKAATSITEGLMNELSNGSRCSDQDSPTTLEYKSLESSTSHLERYAKMIEAVDAILRRDRVQQQIELSKVISAKGGHANVSDLVEEGLESEGRSLISNNGSGLRKTFSVPNLMKNVRRFLSYFSQLLDVSHKR